MSRIGRVYDRVLKLQYRAKEYYKLAIQLAFSMHPRTFNTEGRFVDGYPSERQAQREYDGWYSPWDINICLLHKNWIINKE